MSYWILGCKKCPVNNFEWIEDTCQINEDFIKNYNKESDEGYFLQVDAQYLEKFYDWLTIFTWKNENWKSRKVCS